MPLYLTISRGPRADSATPILASGDPSVVVAALDAIRRLGDPGIDRPTPCGKERGLSLVGGGDLTGEAEP